MLRLRWGTWPAGPSLRGPTPSSPADIPGPTLAGREVLVLEQLDRPGGGSRTEETVAGYRFDLHSAAHNIINMTDIPAELDLAGAGLAYQEMDPFSIAIHADGRRVRFHRSVDATVESIAEESPSEAEAYRRFIDKAVPIVRTLLSGHPG